MPAALILAINPGNSHSPTLARLARELKGYELIGAESCAIAITAMKERVPILVLLPDRTPRGEAELLSRLRSVPGGVLTLRLPPVTSADPPALAKEIRALLETVNSVPAAPTTPVAQAKPAGAPKVSAPVKAATPAKPAAPPKPAGPSPQVIAAAKAAIEWIHTRRAQWAEIDELVRQPIFVPAAATVTGSAYESAKRRTDGHDEPAGLDIDGVFQPREPDFDALDGVPARSRLGTWLPRVAVLAVLIGAAWAGITFWPRTRGTAIDAGGELNTSPDNASEPVQTSVFPPISTTLPADIPAAPSDPAAAVSGYVAVTAPFDISITSANEPVVLDAGGRGALAPGKHRLRLQNSDLGYDETRVVEVKATETTTLNVVPQTALSVSATEPAEVLIDEKPAGETPFKGRLPFGPHTVTVRTAVGERQFKLDPTMKPVRLDVDFTQPQPQP